MIDERGGNAIQILSVFLQTLALGVLLVCVSLIHISAFGTAISLMFIPVAILFFWPQHSNYAPAVFAAFLIGFLQDLVSGGPMGLWALVFTLLFIIIDPTVRRSRGGLLSQWSIFGLLVASAAVLLAVLGWASVGTGPNYASLLMNAGAVITLFPVLFFLRRFLYQVSGRDDVLRGTV